jgi:hypothetical protein
MRDQGTSPALVVAIVALCVFAAAIVWLNRYEVGAVGPITTRLDRFTGQVIGCVPGNGCVEFVPAGSPPLRQALLRREPAGEQGEKATGEKAAGEQGEKPPAQAAPQPAQPAKPK